MAWNTIEKTHKERDRVAGTRRNHVWATAIDWDRVHAMGRVETVRGRWIQHQIFNRQPSDASNDERGRRH